jgi:crossover junction endodeoxyribonuclease RusA
MLAIVGSVSVPSARSDSRRKTLPFKVKKRNQAPNPPIPFQYPRISDTGLEAILPIPPSINHQYATVNGRRVLTAAGRTYKAEVAQLVAVGLARSAQRGSFLDRVQSTSLSLTIRFCFSSALRRDVDSGLKIAQDALCAGLGLNDNRITEIHLYKRQDKDQPRIEVTLSLLDRPLSG